MRRKTDLFFFLIHFYFCHFSQRQGHCRQRRVRGKLNYKEVFDSVSLIVVHICWSSQKQGAEVIFAMLQWIMQSYFWYQTTFNCHINPACLPNTPHYLPENTQCLESPKWSDLCPQSYDGDTKLRSECLQFCSFLSANSHPSFLGVSLFWEIKPNPSSMSWRFGFSFLYWVKGFILIFF